MAFGLKPGSIRGELALLVVALALPLVALIAYNLLETAQGELADADAFVRRLADNSADRATRFIGDAKATLDPLARRELVRAMDPARCDPGLKDILALYPRATNFLVVNREGRILCGAIPPPPDRVVRIQDEALLQEILANGRFALSQPVIGAISRRWTLAAVQPVTGAGGEVAGTVSMSIDLLKWSPLAARSGLPRGAAVALVTAPGIVIATSEDEASWVGRDIGAGEVMRQVRGRQAGVVRARGTVGGDRIWGFREVPGAGWYAVSSIPTDLVYAPLRAQLVRSALLLALALGAALAFALLLGRRLTRPIRAIAEAVRLRTEGREDVRVPVSGPREIAAVATELNRSIEERERAERTLRESEERFRALWETSADAILMLDEESIIRYANPAVLEVFGYRPEELIGRDLALLQPARLAAAHRQGIASYMRTGEKRLDWRSTLTAARRKDGAEFPVEVSFSELRLGERRYFAGFLSDVSDRLRAEQRLALTQRLFGALSEVNETIVRVRDREELFRQVCRICVERIGFVVAYVALIDAAGQRVVPQVYAGAGSGFLGDFTFSLNPADPYAGTVTAAAVRGKRTAVANDIDADPGKQAGRPMRERIGSKASASFPLFQGDQVIGALTLHSAAPTFFDADLVQLLQRMADDLSFALDKLAEQATLAELRRELEERVRRRTAELEAANQELEAFSYSVSHDLRAPVRHVDGFVRLLEKELPQPGEKAAHYLATIASAARRMGALIDDLLQLSRTGRQALALRAVELQPLVRELVAELSQEAGAREVEWTVGEMPSVMADAPLLRIALQNLLSNALKYSRARQVARIGVQVRTLDTGETALSVSDNGVGFDMRFKDKLFGVFQRLHRDEEFEGTGIGLATARRIVHRHGHRIWAESRPGEGATFSFTITRAEVVHEGIADTAGRG